MSAIKRPVTGPSVRPQCACPIASHRPLKPGARPITGRESTKQGRLPSQVLSSARSPSGNSSRAFGISRSNCTGDGGASRAANSVAGGEANALLHRRDQIAVFGVDHRPRQRGIALGAEMPVIAALDGHRQLEAERLEQIGRPRPERDHDLGRVDRRLRWFPPASDGRHDAASARHRSASRRRARETARHRRASPPVDRSGSPPSASTRPSRKPD